MTTGNMLGKRTALLLESPEGRENRGNDHRRPETTTFIAKTLCIGIMWAALLPTVASAGVMFELDFNQDGVLPSAQGLDFLGSGPAVEADVFQVSGGLLLINTSQYGSDVAAYYQISNGFDHTLDTELEFRAKVLSQDGSFGFFAAFTNTSEFGSVVVKDKSWSVPGVSANGSLGSGFHVFNLFSPGNSNTFTLTIDGIVAASGTLSAGSANPSLVFFGDGTPTGGNILAEIDYITYFNGNQLAAVPEPSSLALFASGILGFMGYRRFRRAKANSLSA